MPAGTAHPGNSYRAVSFGGSVDVWRPFPFEGDPSQRGSHYIEGIGRLKPGVTPQQAQAEMNAIMTQLGREHEGDVGWTVHVIPLYEEIVGANQRMLLVLWARSAWCCSLPAPMPRIYCWRVQRHGSGRLPCGWR
jgi:hypothetical protein